MATEDWTQWQHNLLQIVESLQPTAEDCEKRQDLVSSISFLVSGATSIEGCSISVFGSFESNLYTPWADLDLSLQLPTTKYTDEAWSSRKKIKLLHTVERALRKTGRFSKMNLIARARIPVIKFKETRTGISCDISVDNDGGVLKSRVLRWISSIDDRCRQLIFLVKCWARAQNINDPKEGTLNSFALCQLVIFHLQNVIPPILPPLEVILGTMQLNRDVLSTQETKDFFLASCKEKVSYLKAQNYGKGNASMLSQLLVGFFKKFDVPQQWFSGFAVSTYKGDWKECRGCPVMRVEDPFDFSQNCARSVQDSTVQRILESFRKSAMELSAPPAGVKISKLRLSLFKWPKGQRRPIGIKQPNFSPVPRARNVNTGPNHVSPVEESTSDYSRQQTGSSTGSSGRQRDSATSLEVRRSGVEGSGTTDALRDGLSFIFPRSEVVDLSAPPQSLLLGLPPFIYDSNVNNGDRGRVCPLPQGERGNRRGPHHDNDCWPRSDIKVASNILIAKEKGHEKNLRISGNERNV